MAENGLDRFEVEAYLSFSELISFISNLSFSTRIKILEFKRSTSRVFYVRLMAVNRKRKLRVPINITTPA